MCLGINCMSCFVESDIMLSMRTKAFVGAFNIHLKNNYVHDKVRLCQ